MQGSFSEGGSANALAFQVLGSREDPAFTGEELCQKGEASLGRMWPIAMEGKK